MRVVRIAVGSGSPEGTNSAYLLPEAGVLVDPGPPGDEAWAALRSGIEAVCGLETVDHVLVTHWHADHTGLAPRLAGATDATVHMHDADAPFVARYEATRTRRLERDAAALRRWGVPEPAVERVLEGDTPSPLPAETPVDAHADGDSIAGGRLVHTPGHTAGHAAFEFGEHLFVGDALLPTYTPNVGGSDTRVERPLGTYLRTLDRLDSRAGRRTFHPGHGTMHDPSTRIEQIRSHHEKRTQRVAARLTARGRATPWEVAADLFGSLSGIHVKFGAGEAAAHLDHLCALDAADRVGGDVATFEANGRTDDFA